MSRLLAGLVDDAGLFPPAQLPMGAALARHRADEAAGHAMLSHRFLCPAGRLPELRSDPALDGWSPGADGDGRLRLGLILNTGLDGLEEALNLVAGEPRVALDLVEVPAPSAEAVTAALDALARVEVAAYLEGPREPGWVKAVGAWAGPGGLRGAKVRCGGARAELFPSPDELAAFLCACAETAVNFKATAGLHGAVRHRDETTGFVHHGFLNLLLATARAAAKASPDEVAEVLASTDAAALAAEYRALSARAAVLARALFRAYGSCSTSEPLEEAAALGLLYDGLPTPQSPPATAPAPPGPPGPFPAAPSLPPAHGA